MEKDTDGSKSPLESETLQSGDKMGSESGGKSKDAILEHLLASALSRAVDKHCVDDVNVQDVQTSTQPNGNHYLVLTCGPS